MIALYHGGPVGHSASVLIALAEKNIPYESRALDLGAFAQHDTAFLELNPVGQVPVLQVDGRTVTETFFILLYLDECYPDPPLGGADPRARYRIQKWGKYVETHIACNLPIAGRRPDISEAAKTGFDRLPPERRALWTSAASGFSGEEIAAARAALVKAAGRVAEDLAAGSWLAGDSYSLADIVVFPHLARFVGLGIDVPSAVIDWLERVAARPKVREALGAAGVGASLVTMGPERGRWG